MLLKAHSSVAAHLNTLLDLTGSTLAAAQSLAAAADADDTCQSTADAVTTFVLRTVAFELWRGPV